MIVDKPKSGFLSKITKTVAVLAALEVGFVAVSYYAWKRTNPDQGKNISVCFQLSIGMCKFSF